MWSPIFLRGLPEEKEKSVKGQLHGDKWKQLWWWARCSVSVQLCLTLWPHGLQHARLSCPSRTPRTCSNSCPSSLWSHPTISSFIIPFSSRLQSSQHQGLFKWVTIYHQVAKVLEFHLQHQSSNEYSGVISFRMDCLDLLVVQEKLKKLLQHHSSKASVLWRSAFYIVQLSHPYMTTRKTTALTKWIFVGKVMSLLFNMLSRLVITFLPRSKHLLISWLQSSSAVILKPPKIKSDIVSLLFPHPFAMNWWDQMPWS